MIANMAHPVVFPNDDSKDIPYLTVYYLVADDIAAFEVVWFWHPYYNPS